MKKKIVILNIGRWGMVTQDEYDMVAKYLLKDLQKEGLDVVVLDEIPESPEGYSSLIFITRGMLQKAREMKRMFPEKTVILLTGWVEPGDEAEGVAPIWKDGRHVEKIVPLVQ